MKVSIDTRTLEPGDVYIPIKGKNFDGHQFIDAAIQKGASRIVNEDIGTFASKYRKQLKCYVLGITGSFGKTTSKDMLNSVLSQKFMTHATQANNNNEIGVPLTLLGADSHTDVAVLEMAMRKKGEIGYLARIVRPTHVLITGIGLTHAEFFKNSAQIAKAKAEIFRPKLEWERPGDRYAFLPRKDAHYDILESKAKAVGYKVLPYQSGGGIESTLGMCYLIGRHFGLSDHEIERGIASYKPSAHRLIKHKLKGGITLIDDSYNANPDGMRYALGVLKRQSGRKIAVLGDMMELGRFSVSEHRDLADPIIDAEVSVLFTYGEAMKSLGDLRLPVTHFDDKIALIDTLKSELKSGDSVLVKGSRGLEMDSIVDVLLKEINHDN
ncbi:MAG: UDP-N-acetylmuramoyl-tripeptide--D-alanyl-D-alanine ligase [bacterium]|nr:UDP-N-acetylmuramoyl-tripeptide--D-alanyl-D-alanine ligase [bacterium]